MSKQLVDAEVLDFVILDGDRRSVYAIMQKPTLYNKTGHVEAIIQNYDRVNGFSLKNLILSINDSFEFISDKEVTKILDAAK